MEALAKRLFLHAASSYESSALDDAVGVFIAAIEGFLGHLHGYDYSTYLTHN